MIQEVYSDTVLVCQDRVRKAKAHPDFNLVRDTKGNSKDFHKYTSGKMKTRENMNLLLSTPGDLETKGIVATKILNTMCLIFYQNDWPSVFMVSRNQWGNLKQGRLTLHRGGPG